MRSAWTLLALSFLAFIYMVSGFTSFVSDATPFEWLLAIGGIGCWLLMMFQCVKSILHDMHEKEPVADDTGR